MALPSLAQDVPDIMAVSGEYSVEVFGVGCRDAAGVSEVAIAVRGRMGL